MGPVCILSEGGDAYVGMLGTSEAVIKTESTAEWLVPTWSEHYPGYYDYSAFSSEERALCTTAIDGLWPVLPESEPVVTCTPEQEAVGGAGS